MAAPADSHAARFTGDVVFPSTPPTMRSPALTRMRCRVHPAVIRLASPTISVRTAILESRATTGAIAAASHGRTVPPPAYDAQNGPPTAHAPRPSTAAASAPSDKPIVHACRGSSTLALHHAGATPATSASETD